MPKYFDCPYFIVQSPCQHLLGRKRWTYNPSVRQKVIAGWALLCVVALLLRAISRVLSIGLEAFEHSLSALQWILLTLWLICSAYAEGYRGFQKGFVPRVVSRAFYLGAHPTLLRLVLALPFVMGLFYATKKRMIASWMLTLGITLLVVLMNYVPQPWRGIVDLGVVVGLAWGLVALLFSAISAFTKDQVPAPKDLPSSYQPAKTI